MVRYLPGTGVNQCPAGQTAASLFGHKYKWSVIQNEGSDAVYVRGELKKWKIKIDIIFVIDNFSFENYEVILYNSGICNGYVHLNGEEIHFLPGDIESFYEKIVEKINKED